MPIKPHRPDAQFGWIHPFLGRKMPARFSSIPRPVAQWIVAKALDPTAFLELVTPPKSSRRATIVSPRDGDILPSAARKLVIAFSRWPELAPELWLWARKIGRKKVRSKTGQARDIMNIALVAMTDGEELDEQRLDEEAKRSRVALTYHNFKDAKKDAKR